MLRRSHQGVAPISLIGIVALCVIIGGILYVVTRERTAVPGTPAAQVVTEQTTEAPSDNFSKLDKDQLLRAMFPEFNFKNGVAQTSSIKTGDASIDFINSFGKLYLQSSTIDHFIDPNEKELLLVVRLDGIPHVGGLYHAYLGLFNEEGVLIAPMSGASPKEDPFVPVSSNGMHLGGDFGDFRLYKTGGVQYIAFASGAWPNGTCGDSEVDIYHIEEGNFEKTQIIDAAALEYDSHAGMLPMATVFAAGGSARDYALRFTLQDDSIVVKKVPSVQLEGRDGCPETDYKVLHWNSDSGLFEW